MNRPVYIHAAAALGPHGDLNKEDRRPLSGDAESIDLEPRMGHLREPALRRISHFSRLALLAGHALLSRLEHPMDPDAALYFGTGLGESRGTIELFKEVMAEGTEYTSAYSFVNSVNNTTPFFLARTARLFSQNLTLSQEEFSFEWALRLALIDLRSGVAPQALVGGTDEMVFPITCHRTRIGYAGARPLGEGSGWLLLGLEAAGALGEVLFVRELPEGAAGLAGISELAGEERVRLLPGYGLPEGEIEGYAESLPGCEVVDYLPLCGVFPTAAAFAAAALFDGGDGGTLNLHVNRDGFGRTLAMAIRVY